VTTVFHVFGLGPGILGTMVAGASLILQEQFEPAEALALIEKHRATVHYGVPTVFITELRELEERSYDLSSLRTGSWRAPPSTMSWSSGSGPSCAPTCVWRIPSPRRHRPWP
jgi:acyl-CoA synthetase (AMP-forming)/AMP-acid ligase II